MRVLVTGANGFIGRYVANYKRGKLPKILLAEVILDIVALVAVGVRDFSTNSMWVSLLIVLLTLDLMKCLLEIRRRVRITLGGGQ